MFLKIILGLALFIVIAALGANSGLGDGFFSFKAKGKAADLVEFSRDIATVMQTYKADHNSNVSVFTVIDQDVDSRTGVDVVDPAVAAGVVQFGTVVQELQVDGLLKGDGSYEIGGFSVVSLANAVPANGDDLILVNVSPEITDEICEKLNEVVGIPTALAPTADLTSVTDTEVNTTELTAAMVTTLDTAAAGFSLMDGVREGVCIQDTSAAGKNAFMFYVQKN